MKFIKNIDERFTENSFNPNPKHIEGLTPVYNADPDKTYSENLLWALRDTEIKNIALTGPYGSGKSSVLKTFEQAHPEFNYLKISLASFEEDLKNNNDLTTKNVDRKNIEISILQQIFYKVKGQKVPYSRFRRIRSTSFWVFLIRALLLLAWLISGAFIFKPTFFNRLSYWKTFNDKHGDLILYVATLIFVIVTVKQLITLFRTYNSAKFQKLNISNGELELAQETDTSILNKHLDEILYFFEVTTFDVVIIEDLDRFEDPEIFTKLRELNNLINGSNQIKRQVTFVYALRDDIFKDSNRTKFFDFLIPIIPVINSSNSGEILLKKFIESGTKGNISDTFISDITLFIDDMRMLKNVYNEYTIYKKKLGLNLNQEKLLGIIIYKNFYPSDFADLNSNKGSIYGSFVYKEKIISDLIIENEKVINELNIQIEKLEEIIINNAKELRSVYVIGVLQRLPTDTYRISLDNNPYTTIQLVEPEIFNLLKKQINIQYLRYNYGSYQPSGIGFKAIEKEINPEFSYDEREKSVTQKVNGDLEKLETELKKLKEVNSSIKGWTLKELIANKSSLALHPETAKDKLLVYLLRQGHIDEMYHSYTSYFYEGTITRTDMDFVMSIKSLSALDFNFNLSKIDQIVKKLRLTEYSQKEILNYSMVDYLALNSSILQKEFTAVIKQLADQTIKSKEFIHGYLSAGDKQSIIIKAICKEWPGVWEYVLNNKSFTTEIKDNYLKSIIRYADPNDLEKINSNRVLSSYISKKEDFLHLLPNNDAPKVKDIIRLLRIKFKHLTYFDEAKDLFDFVYQNNHYVLNEQMIELVLNNKGAGDSTLSEKLKKENYTTIITSGCAQLISYVNKNIDEYFEDVFMALPENTHEEEKAILSLINIEDLTEDYKKEIINKELHVFNNIIDLPPYLWDQALAGDKVAPQWSNLQLYFQQPEKSKEILIEYLNRQNNFETLSKNKVGKTDGEDLDNIKALNLFILENKDISDQAYQYLIKSSPWYYYKIDIEKLSAVKVDTLLSNNILVFSKDNYDSLKKYFSNKHIVLLEKSYNIYLSKSDQFEFDSNDYSLIFASKTIMLDQKINLIAEMKITLINNSTLSEQVSSLILQKKVDIEFALFKQLLLWNKDLALKTRLINFQFKKLSLAQLEESLNLVGGTFAQINKKGNRPKISKNIENEELVTKLKSISYISSYSSEKDKIVINTKRK